VNNQPEKAMTKLIEAANKLETAQIVEAVKAIGGGMIEESQRMVRAALIEVYSVRLGADCDPCKDAPAFGLPYCEDGATQILPPPTFKAVRVFDPSIPGYGWEPWPP
jgi:hypothetical protein